MEQVFATLSFSQSDMATINECLMAGPYGKVAPVVNRINAQLAEARKKEQEANLPDPKLNPNFGG